MPVNSITLTSPAKLNLFLHITGRRPDGYHTLQTIFQLLDWGDAIRYTLNEDKGIRLTCSDPSLESNDNLIIKAAASLEKLSGQKLNVDIHLNKVLPMGGGIGGGSSNAATTLLALNKLTQLRLPQQQLMSIAAGLGADVPVFVNGVTAWAEGIGDRLTTVDITETWYLIIHPNAHVSTQQLFTNPELTRNTPVSTICPALADTGHNDFEPLVRRLYPEIENAFQAAASFGKPQLTGTGACLFIKMPTETRAHQSLQLLTTEHPELNVYLAKGVASSATLTELANVQPD